MLILPTSRDGESEGGEEEKGGGRERERETDRQIDRQTDREYFDLSSLSKDLLSLEYFELLLR